MLRPISRPAPAPAETETDAAMRIASVLPLLTIKARRWLRSLPPRVRRALDVDDVLQELWAKLLDADHHFDPTIAQYVTWATTVADRALWRLADHLCRQPGGTLDADPADRRAETPLETVLKTENRQRAAEAVGRAIERLDDRRHAIIVRYYGIGRPSQNVQELARWFVEPPGRIHQLRIQAENQLRTMLTG